VGAGTYIRALARDLGFLLGQAAVLEFLQRSQVGYFDMAGAWKLDMLEQLPEHGRAAFLTGSEMLAIPVRPVAHAEAVRLMQGKVDAIPSDIDCAGVVALTCEGDVIAVVEGPPWRFRKVLVKDEG
jgi:tRNA pseudouridine55 synthase